MRLYFDKKKIYCLALIFFIIQTSQALASRHPWIGSAVAESVLATSSPDNNLLGMVSLFDSAKKNIHISVYHLDHFRIVAALERALERNVKVVILFEGSPVPTISQTELYQAKRLSEKGAKIYFYRGELSTGVPTLLQKRDYKYFHAKYTIVDYERVSLGSANFGNSGHPVTPVVGNREWEVFITGADVAKFYEAAFAHDLSLKSQLVPYGATTHYTYHGDPVSEPVAPKEGAYRFKISPVRSSHVKVHTVFAPENALTKSSTHGHKYGGLILDVLRSAKQTVDINQLSFEKFWGLKVYNHEKEPSPFLEAVVELARAGKHIRVLLNDDGVFKHPKNELAFGPLNIFSGDYLMNTDEDRAFGPMAFFTAAFFDPYLIVEEPKKEHRDNRATVAFINEMARQESLPVEARLQNLRDCGIKIVHNKGMIVDQEKTLVGSINWGEGALKLNREAGILIEDSQIAQYYARLFDYDWQCSKH